MRESIGGAWLYGLVITFILFFVAFLSITSNYTKAFRLKNEMLDFIEREEGMTLARSSGGAPGGTIPLINNYLFQTGYGGQGRCPKADGKGVWYGVSSLGEPPEIEESRSGQNYFYCFRKINSPDYSNPDRAYYEVDIFFRLDIPVIGNLINLKVAGTSNTVSYPADCGNAWGNCPNFAGNVKPIYTITFDSDGGTPTPETQYIQQSNKIDTKIIPTPTKDGCEFEGWYNGNSSFNFNGAINANYLLKAKWTCTATPSNYTVTFNANGGSPTPETKIVAAGAQITKPTNPTKTGCTFNGWYDGVGAFIFSTKIDKNYTLTADWTCTTYTVKFNASGGSPTPPDKTNIAPGGTITAPTTPTKTGLTFDGWRTGSATGSKYVFGTPVNSNFTLYAAWGYLITFVIETKHGSNSYSNQIVSAGGTATKPIDPVSNAVSDFGLSPYFKGWRIGNNCGPYFSFDTVINQNYNLYAYFQYPGETPC